jgi:hypothetical protein
MMRAAALALSLVLCGCEDGSEVDHAKIDATANQISADTEALVAARVAQAEARGNEASAARAE